VIRPGAVVELLVNDDVEYAFEEATGHRDAPANKLVRMTARAVARTSWEDASDNMSMIGIGAAACFIDVVLVEVGRRQLREEHRLLLMLIDAPELPDTGGLRETWGSIEGVARDPTPVTAEGEASAVVHVVDETATLGDSDPAKVVQRVLSAGTFFVDTSSGAKYEVDPAVRFKKATTGKLASTGPESLLFFAAEPGDSARRASRFLVRARSMSLAVILLCAAGVVALGAFAERRLPAFSFGTDGTSD
jgi:hypothetical protein